MLRTGRPRATIAQEDRNIERDAMRNMFLTTTTIAQCASTSRDSLVTSRMMQQRLKEKDLRVISLLQDRFLWGNITQRGSSLCAIMSPKPSMKGNESYSPMSLVSRCMGLTVVIESGGGWELDINSKILLDDQIFLAVREWFRVAYSMMRRWSSMCVAGQHWEMRHTVRKFSSITWCLSHHLLGRISSFNEIMLVLTLLELPWTSWKLSAWRRCSGQRSVQILIPSNIYGTRWVESSGNVIRLFCHWMSSARLRRKFGRPFLRRMYGPSLKVWPGGWKW